jgi:hypothetical protein
VNSSLPTAVAGAPRRRALAGLLVQRPCWTLSGPGWLLLAAGLALLGLGACWQVRPFLAVTRSTPAEVLVVEGWMPAAGLKAAAAVFRNGGYREILTCGAIAREDSGERTGVTYADWGAQRLRRFGLADSTITPVPCFEERRDRTYSSALAVGRWLEQNRPGVTAIDVVSFDAHARRSRLLFQKALGRRVAVGIISVPNRDYDPAHWWRSSEGVREVVGESLAYLYVRLFFWPAR